jgi:glycosyltransferase involved in cell wall biosynthesis
MKIGDNPPLFSVVIACYNYGRFLARAIDSALAQTYTNFEIVVVDDGSTDETAEVAARYVGRIVYHRQQNAGHCATNNKGAALARGEYIYFLDADDELLPNALQSFADAIARCPNIPVFFGGYISVSEDGAEKTQNGSDIPKAPKPRLRAFLLKKVIGLKHGGTVLHRRIFSQLHYPANLRSNTDIVFLGQVLAHFEACGIHTPVVKSHAHRDRVRKQKKFALEPEFAIADIFFNPAIMPANLMPLRKLFVRQKALSLGRKLYRQHAYRDALHCYALALRTAPLLILQPTLLKRVIISILRLLVSFLARN